MTRSTQVGLEPLPERFELTEGVVYLNCANMSPQLKAVRAAGIEAVHARSRPWELSSADWFTGADTLRGLAARILDASDDSVALVPSVSYGIAIAAGNVPIRSGQSIVLLDQQFPSNVYAWRRLAEASEGNLRHVPRPESGEWTDAVVESIDDTTAVVSVPNCHWTDGSLVDLRRIGERARAVGAAFVVDASQSLGAYPLSVKELKPDFLVSVGYKWLLGPYGLAYLYVGPRFRDSGRPLEESWMSRAGSSDFSRLVDYTDAYRPGARRFDMGELAQFVAIPQAIAALEQILAWGVENIQASLSRMTRRIAQGARSSGGSALDEPQRAGHLVGLRMPAGLPETLAKTLSDARVHVSLRGDCIRVGPHLHTTLSDIDRFLDVLGNEASRSRGPGRALSTRKAYDASASRYHDKFRRYAPYREKLLQFVESVRAGGTVVDLGCGSGFNARWMTEAGLKVTGYDYSEAMLQIARRECPQCDFHLADLRQLPETRAFDAVVASFCIVHFDHEEALGFLQALPKLMARDSSLYLSFMEGSTAGWAATTFSERPLFYNYFDRDWVTGILSEAGLERVSASTHEYPEQGGSTTTDVFLVFKRATAVANG